MSLVACLSSFMNNESVFVSVGTLEESMRTLLNLSDQTNLAFKTLSLSDESMTRLTIR